VVTHEYKVYSGWESGWLRWDVNSSVNYFSLIFILHKCFHIHSKLRLFAWLLPLSAVIDSLSACCPCCPSNHSKGSFDRWSLDLIESESAATLCFALLRESPIINSWSSGVNSGNGIPGRLSSLGLWEWVSEWWVIVINHMLSYVLNLIRWSTHVPTPIKVPRLVGMWQSQRVRLCQRLWVPAWLSLARGESENLRIWDSERLWVSLTPSELRLETQESASCLQLQPCRSELKRWVR